MPNESLTEIAVILDRSGSMAQIQADMVGGFDAFVAAQKKVEGEAVMSLYQFDDLFDVVFEDRPLGEVGPLELAPRGLTALLDGMGKAITMIGERLKAKPEAERPGSVIVLVITDGMENASKEFKRDAVRQMVEHQRTKYDWQFAFLGANMDAIGEARSVGVSGSSAQGYVASGAGVQGMMVNSANAVANYRKAKQDYVLHIQEAATAGFGASAMSIAKPELSFEQDAKKDKEP